MTKVKKSKSTKQCKIKLLRKSEIQQSSEKLASDASKSGIHFSNFSDEVKLKIFEKLDVQTLITCSNVCPDWRNLVSDKILLRNQTLILWEKDGFEKNCRTFEYVQQHSDTIRKFFYTFHPSYKFLFNIDSAHYDILKCQITILTRMLIEFFMERRQQLTHLKLKCWLNWDIFEQVNVCSNLQELSLENGFYNNYHMFCNIVNLKKLRKLEICNIPIEEIFLLRSIRNNTSLKYLTLENLVINNYHAHSLERILKTIANNSEIATLNLIRCGKLTRAGATFLSQSRHLEELTLSNLLMEDFSASIATIAQGCSKLKKLNMHYSKTVNHKWILPSLPYLKNLTDLTLSFSNKTVTIHCCRQALAKLKNVCRINLNFERRTLLNVEVDEIKRLKRRYPRVHFEVNTAEPDLRLVVQ